MHNVSRSPCDLPGVTNHVLDLATLDVGRLAADVKNTVAGITTNLEQREVFLDGLVRMCVIHNAGAVSNDTIQELGADPETLARLMSINVIAPALLTSALLPLMTQIGGARPLGSSVLFIGSTLSEKAVVRSLSYVTSKHAVVGLMRSTTQDLFGSGIHTACLCPGIVDTDMVRKDRADKAQPDFVKDLVSFQRLVEPREIASLCLFAADNPAINGSVIHANLGQREL